MKSGDYVVDNKTKEVCRIYDIYPDGMMSLCLREYDGVEADNCVKQSDFTLLDEKQERMFKVVKLSDELVQLIENRADYGRDFQGVLEARVMDNCKL